MTYKDMFVVEIKHNGKIMRVKDDFVTLPFGSEYSILLKNLNSRRASVDINIDGQDVLDGNSLIINGNESVELEGFLKGNTAKNKFKFIKKTEAIINHRGDKIDDGMIRVEFAYEVEKPVRIKQIINEYHYHTDWNSIYEGSVKSPFVGGVHTFASTGSPNCDAPENIAKSFSARSLETPIDDMGITVKGSEINQDFQYASIGRTDPSQVIIIHLKGLDSQGQAIKQPISIQTKLTCSSCGKKSKSSFKFCPDCGTFLE